MKRWIKRTLYGTLITLGSIIVLLIIVLGTLSYVVFTPQRLTPIVEQIASEYIDADLSFSEIELTAISTFPNIGIRLCNGLLRSTSGDTLAVSDTIVSFDLVEIVANPMDFLFRNEVTINKVSLTHPRIYAYTDSLGRSNWDVFRMSADTTQTTDTTTFDASIALKKFKIDGGHIVFDDRSNKIYGKLDTLNVSLTGNMKKVSDVDFQMSFRRGLFWRDSKVLTKRLSGSIDLRGEYDPAVSRLTISQSSIGINDITLKLSGTVNKEQLELNAEVVSPTLATVVAMLPRAYIREADNMKAKGSVSIKGKLSGRYLGGALPLAEVEVVIANGGFHYEGLEYGVEDLDMVAKAHIKLDSLADSRVDIKELNVAGDAIKLSLTGSVTDIIENPTFKAKLFFDVDFNKLAKTLPLEKNTNVDGKLSFNGDVSSSKNAIMKQNWAQISAKGAMTMSNLKFNDPANNIDFTTSDASLTIDHSKKAELTIEGTLGNVYFGQMPAYQASLHAAKISLSATRTPDSVTTIKGTLGFNGLSGSMASDSLQIYSSASSIKLQASKQMSRLRFRSDTILVTALHSKAQLLSAGINVTLKEKLVRGLVSFANLNVETPHFPLKINVDSTTVKLNNNRIELTRAQIKVGRSQLSMNGSVENLFLGKPDSKTIIRGEINSQTLNLNQIIRAIDQGAKHSHSATSTETENIAIEEDDTTALPLILIDPKIDARLKASFNKLRFGKLRIDNSHGEIEISDGRSIVRDLTVNYKGATLNTSVIYDPKSSQRASATVSISADRVDLNSLKGVTPYIDSLSPMVASVEGIVALRLAAHAELKNTFMPDINDIQAAVRIHGDSLVVLDNETFASISKMLMFKNKQRNIIDSLDVQAVLDNGRLEIFPFAMELDRYRVAAGGTQMLDGAMSYHVSVLRSPIPFKFGVNVTGTFDKFKIAVVKTQFKELFPPNGPISNLNPLYIDTRKRILAPFQ